MQSKIVQVSRKAVLAAALGLWAVFGMPAAAHAEGGLFGAIARLLGGDPPPPPPPSQSGQPQARQPQSIWDFLGLTTTPGKPETPQASYCVRTCDGRYFPVSKSAGPATLVQTCQTMCPAAETKVYFGPDIDNAFASDGSKYSSLSNAYVYRDKFVPGCSCTGRDIGGLARMRIEDDPTLRAGDIVMTETGPVVFQGSSALPHKMSEFVPISESRNYSGAIRIKLMTMKAMPKQPATAENVHPHEPRTASRKPEPKPAQALNEAPETSPALGFIDQ